MGEERRERRSGWMRRNNYCADTQGGTESQRQAPTQRQKNSEGQACNFSERQIKHKHERGE